MRRPAPTLPISSQQLKRFAAATVAITTLLALFAGGDDIGVAAQIDATRAKNELVAAEQKKLGTKQLATHMKVKANASAGFGEDSDSGFGEGGGGGGGGSGGGDGAGVPPTRSGMPKAKPKGKQDSESGFSSSATAGDPANSARPDPSRLRNAVESSRQRSGSADASDD